MSYAALWSSAERVAAAFRSQGVRRGVNIGLALPNSLHHIVMSFGAFLAGGTVVNLSSEAAPRMLQSQIVDTGVKLLVCASDPTKDHAGLIREAGLQTLVVCDLDTPPDQMGSTEPRAETMEGCQVLNLRAFLDSGLGEDPASEPELDDIALIQFTGGTTGAPKGAMLRHSNVATTLETMRRWMEPALTAPDRLKLLALPLSHIFGFCSLAVCLSTGTPIILLRKFDPWSALDQIEQRKVTLMFGVPTIYAAMLSSGMLSKERTESLKLCLVGGAPLSPSLMRSFLETTGIYLRQGYGMTETSALAALQPAVGPPKASATGLPVPGTTIEIVDMQAGDRLLPTGQIGEVCLTGPQIMAGYWRNPEATAEAFDGGRLHTGDVGLIDEDGYLTLLDRKKDMILCGGFNVYPAVVEAALCEHPDVMEAAVVGVPDELVGYVVKAFVRARPGASPCGLGQMLPFLAERLASYELPATIEWRDDLPKTPAGKIARNRLVEPAEN